MSSIFEESDDELLCESVYLKDSQEKECDFSNLESYVTNVALPVVPDTMLKSIPKTSQNYNYVPIIPKSLAQPEPPKAIISNEQCDSLKSVFVSR